MNTSATMALSGVVLHVDRKRVAVDGGRGGVFPLEGARLRLWRMPSIGVTYGSALELWDEGVTYRIGGNGYRLPDALPVGVVEDVDAHLCAPSSKTSSRSRGSNFPARPPRTGYLPRRLRSCGALSRRTRGG